MVTLLKFNMVQKDQKWSYRQIQKYPYILKYLSQRPLCRTKCALCANFNLFWTIFDQYGYMKLLFNDPHNWPTVGGGGVQTKSPKTKPIFRNVQPMHFTLWPFTVANPGVKNNFILQNNSCYEVCSCYILYLRCKKTDSGPKFARGQGGLESLVKNQSSVLFCFECFPLLVQNPYSLIVSMVWEPL